MAYSANLWRIREPRGSSLVELALVSTVVTILGTRFFLALTGFPQVGNGTLHIAHLLWGGLLMLIAMLIALQAADRVWKPVIALFFGVGFGLFLDEIGKFVTRDNDYFFKPSLAIMYVVIVLILLSTRFLAWMDRKPPQEQLYFATQTLAASWLGLISERERDIALHVIDSSGITSNAATHLRSALQKVDTIEKSGGVSWRTWDSFWQRLQARLSGQLFQRFVFGMVLLYASLYALTALFIGDISLPHTSIGWINSGWQTAVGLLLCIGSILWIRHHQLSALKLFYNAMIIMVLIGQVFTFAHNNFYGLINLFVNLVVLFGLRAAITSSETMKATIN